MTMIRVGRNDLLPQTVSILDAPVADIDMAGLVASFDMALKPELKALPGRYVCFRDAHGLVHGLHDSKLMDAHHKAMLVVPDGMPLVWIGRMRGAIAINRVAGMDAVPLLASEGVSRGWRHVFVGGAPGVAERLAKRLQDENPGMIVAGIECPPFRPQTEAESDAMIARINAMKPDLVWIGLGSPKQDIWMSDFAHRINGAICLGVGGAFDTHAGHVRRAPVWMQRAGLEWAFRLAQEPRRLWKRYSFTIPRFMLAVAKEEWHRRLNLKHERKLAVPLPIARTADDMTPPGTIKEVAKRALLRTFRERIAPVAYLKSEGGLKPLTFHYMFDQDRENGEAIFRALKREGDFISTAQMLEVLRSGQPIRERLFHVSVDDGFANVLHNAWPIMKSLNIPFSFMVCPDFVGADIEGLRAFSANAEYARILPMATWDELRQASREGVEIGAHTLSHRRMSALGEADLRREIFESKARIEAEIGRPCTSFAWPFGRRDAISARGIALSHEAGFETVFSSIRGTVSAGDGVPVYLPRHHFEPGWALRTVLYYATRKEAPFFIPPTA